MFSGCEQFDQKPNKHTNKQTNNIKNSKQDPKKKKKKKIKSKTHKQKDTKVKNNKQGKQKKGKLLVVLKVQIQDDYMSILKLLSQMKTCLWPSLRTEIASFFGLQIAQMLQKALLFQQPLKVQP